MSKHILFFTTLSFFIASCGNENSNSPEEKVTSQTDVVCKNSNEGEFLKPIDSDKEYVCMGGIWKPIPGSSSSMVATSDNRKKPNEKNNISSSSEIIKNLSSFEQNEKLDNGGNIATTSSSSEQENDSSSSHKTEESSSSEEAKIYLCDDGITYVLNLENCELESSSSEESSSSSDNSSPISCENESSSSKTYVESSSEGNAEESSSSGKVEESSSSDEQSSSSGIKIAEVKPNNYYRTNCPEGLTCEYVNTEFLNQDMLSAGIYGEILDERDGKVYKTIEIDEQVWMAQNLDYDTAWTSCYENISENCKKYGRFYGKNYTRWNDDICPHGWIIPDEMTYKNLISYAVNISGLPIVDNIGNVQAGGLLKSECSDWEGWHTGDFKVCDIETDDDCNSGRGTNELGLSIFPLGTGYDSMDFSEYGKFGELWSKKGYCFTVYHSHDFGFYLCDGQRHPIRCILKQ